MKKELVVITGGPGTGKTTIIDALIEQGYACFPEISRNITLNAKKEGIDQLFLDKPLLFSELLLDGRIKQHIQASQDSSEIVFLDRGIPDILAYMHYIGDEYPPLFDHACSEYSYTKVFVLPPWENIYEEDEARYENFEQAKLIHTHLYETYLKYGYKLIDVPIGTVEDRIQFILSHLV